MALGAGDLVVNLRMNNRQFADTTETSARATAGFVRVTERSTRELQDNALTMRVNQSAVSNLAYAIEDIGSVYGTQGLAGAVRASSNNLTAMAATLGPQAALVAAITSTVTQLGLAYLSTGEKAEESAERQTKAFEEMSRVRQRDMAGIERRHTREDLGGQSVVDLKDRRDDLLLEDRMLGEQLGRLKRERDELQEGLARQDRIADRDPDLLEDESFVANRQGIEDELAEVLGAIEPLSLQRLDVGRQFRTVEAQIPLAQREEAEGILREGDEFTHARRSEMFNAQRRERLARRREQREREEAARLQELSFLQSAGQKAMDEMGAEQTFANQEFHRRSGAVNRLAGTSQAQSDFLSLQAIGGGGATSDEQKQTRLLELIEKHLQKDEKDRKQRESQEKATTAEEFAVATFP